MKVKSLSRVQLFSTPWTAAYQAPPSVGFSRQEYWSGVPSLSLESITKVSCLFVGLIFTPSESELYSDDLSPSETLVHMSLGPSKKVAAQNSPKNSSLKISRCVIFFNLKKKNFFFFYRITLALIHRVGTKTKQSKM